MSQSNLNAIIKLLPTISIIVDTSNQDSHPPCEFRMCLFNPIKHYMLSRRNATAARREAKLEKNDHQRLNENLLKIALKRHTSVNSLTDRDPTKVAMEKKLAWEEEMAKK